MKEKLKNTKGITLIALVITIIVLLILAMVSINLIMNENIIKHANNAVTAYNEAQTNELQKLNWVENQIKDYGGQTTTTTPIVPQLTAEEKEALKAAGFYTDLGPFGRYLVAAYEYDDGEYGEVYSYEGGALMYFISKNDGGWITYTFTGEDDKVIEQICLEDGITFEKNKWYSMPDGSDFSLATEYNGEFPLTEEIIAKSTVTCQTYFDRMFHKAN